MRGSLRWRDAVGQPAAGVPSLDRHFPRGGFMHRRNLALLALVAAAFSLLAVQAGTAASPLKKPPKPKHHHVAPAKKPKPAPAMNATQKLGHVKHLVVIYEENHSFDNLYGSW